ncbi:tRNA pseudouridine(38-40) synthase TruA [Alkalibacillus aidingensis]|uniref:tRNA pseudouridine(38-40) synthase TruA n=1 Tax=Alkalibacillus aidingensis TaxID=2747607 RepID=UPI001660459F|nr:tRNA pseudouridine(38-40) synthase TruA [Alkalibacillus aidingensis]
MERIKITFAYDGTYFSGYQVQLEKRTVQLVIEKALAKMHGEEVRIYSSGRTDAGVHAYGQVIHFNSPLSLDRNAWHRALETLLPNDIQIQRVEKVDDNFHARKSAKGKTYRYIVLNDHEYDLFQRLYEWHVKKPLNVEKIQEAAQLLVGRHDFTAFSASKSNVKGDKTRTIYSLDVWQEGKRVIFQVRGDGFLTHMVRIIVGTLVEIGLGKRNSSCIKDGLETFNRQVVGMTAPGHGLCLWEVNY